MILIIDGQPIRLFPEVAVMVVALLDHQEAIHRQGVGEVALDYHGCEVVYTLKRHNGRAKARKLIDNFVKSAS